MDNTNEIVANDSHDFNSNCSLNSSIDGDTSVYYSFSSMNDSAYTDACKSFTSQIDMLGNEDDSNITLTNGDLSEAETIEPIQLKASPEDLERETVWLNQLKIQEAEESFVKLSLNDSKPDEESNTEEENEPLIGESIWLSQTRYEDAEALCEKIRVETATPEMIKNAARIIREPERNDKSHTALAEAMSSLNSKTQLIEQYINKFERSKDAKENTIKDRMKMYQQWLKQTEISLLSELRTQSKDMAKLRKTVDELNSLSLKVKDYMAKRKTGSYFSYKEFCSKIYQLEQNLETQLDTTNKDLKMFRESFKMDIPPESLKRYTFLQNRHVPKNIEKDISELNQQLKEVQLVLKRPPGSASREQSFERSGSLDSSSNSIDSNDSKSGKRKRGRDAKSRKNLSRKQGNNLGKPKRAPQKRENAGRNEFPNRNISQKDYFGQRQAFNFTHMPGVLGSRPYGFNSNLQGRMPQAGIGRGTNLQAMVSRMPFEHQIKNANFNFGSQQVNRGTYSFRGNLNFEERVQELEQAMNVHAQRLGYSHYVSNPGDMRNRNVHVEYQVNEMKRKLQLMQPHSTPSMQLHKALLEQTEKLYQQIVQYRMSQQAQNNPNIARNQYQKSLETLLMQQKQNMSAQQQLQQTLMNQSMFQFDTAQKMNRGSGIQTRTFTRTQQRRKDRQPKKATGYQADDHPTKKLKAEDSENEEPETSSTARKNTKINYSSQKGYPTTNSKVARISMVSPNSAADKQRAGISSMVVLDQLSCLVVVDIINSCLKLYDIGRDRGNRNSISHRLITRLVVEKPFYMAKLNENSVIFSQVDRKLSIVKVFKRKLELVRTIEMSSQYYGLSYVSNNVIAGASYEFNHIDLMTVDEHSELSPSVLVNQIQGPELLTLLPSSNLIMLLERVPQGSMFLTAVQLDGTKVFSVDLDSGPQDVWNLACCGDKIVCCCKQSGKVKLYSGSGDFLIDLPCPKETIYQPFAMAFSSCGHLYLANDGLFDQKCDHYVTTEINVLAFLNF